MLIAALALIAAVAAYGWSGLRLAAGSRAEGGALRTADWWIGTGLQGVGFLTSLLARTVLPLLLVQAAIAGALAVTAALEHATGVRRLTAPEVGAVVATVAGIGAVAAAVVAGPSRPALWTDALILAALLAATAVAVPLCRGAGVLGAWSGVAFGTGAVGARLLVGSGASLAQLSRFWEWSAPTWCAAVAMPTGIVLGQWALTRALARGSSVAALGGDYLLATVVPSVLGVALLGEQLRPGMTPVAVGGVAVALWGTRRLLRTPA